MNRINRIIAILALVFIIPLSSMYAEIGDYASLLTNSQIKTLEEKIDTLESLYTIKHNGKSNKIGIYIVTLPNKEMISAENYEIGELSEALYESWEYGLGTEKTGLLLLMDMNEREFNICAHGSAANYTFTDYGKDELVDAFLDDFAEDNWYAGFYHYLVEVEHQLMLAEKGKPVGIEVGLYTLKSITNGGQTITSEELKEMVGIVNEDFSAGSVTINKDGTGELTIMGETMKLLSNGKILALEVDAAPFTLIEDILTVYIDDDTMVFVRKE